MPPTKDIQKVFKRIINNLLMELASLLSIDNVGDAGWGVFVLGNHPYHLVFPTKEQG